MVAELGLEELFGQVSQALNKKLSKDLKLKLARNIKKVLQQKAAPALKARLLTAYDELISRENYGPVAAGKDPLALEVSRGLFEAQITKELNNVRIEGDSIVINIGDKDAWGFGEAELREGPLKTVDFLHFYIEGNIGEFGFITLGMYISRRSTPGTLGRFGEGFLISKEQYKKEKWEKATGVKFEDIRHPISGQPPYNGFNRAVENFDFSPYITEAVQETFKNIGRSLV